jgi:hypothetical protein
MKAYQSDQMGIYGEYYVFFKGYLALGVFFTIAFVLQIIFVSIRRRNALLTCIYRALIIYLFYIWLNSYGFDWFIFDSLTAVIITTIFARYYVSNN